MKSKEQIAKQFEGHLKSGEGKLSKQYENTRVCDAAYAGDMISVSDSIAVGSTRGRRKTVSFNKAKPYINSVQGFFAQNRRRGKFNARVDDSAQQVMYSRNANSLADIMREKANADQEETQMDGDMLRIGYGAIDTALSYGDGYSTTDPNGQLIIGRIDPLSVFWDPAARAKNLVDARYTGYKRVYDLDSAMELFDDADEEDFEGACEDEDTGYEYTPNNGRYDRAKLGVAWDNETENLVKVHFYQWFEIETFYRAENPLAGLQTPEAVQRGMDEMRLIASQVDDDARDMFTLNPEAEIITFDKDLKAALQDAFGSALKPYPFKRKVFYTAVISGNTVFSAFRSPSQTGFSIKFKTADWDAQNNIWTGMMNPMLDPQRYADKAITEMLYLIASNAKGGKVYEKGAIPDIKAFEKNWNKTDGHVEVAEGALSGGKIADKRGMFSAAGYDTLLQICDNSFADVTGLDKVIFGMNGATDETGVLQRQRIRQVFTTLAGYVDSITLYEKLEMRLQLDYMRIYVENNDGQLYRLLGEDGATEYKRMSGDMLAAEYDVDIEEAPRTPDEKNAVAQALFTAGNAMMQVQDPTWKICYTAAFRNLPLDPRDMQQIAQSLNPQAIDPAQVQQLQQKIQDLTQQVQALNDPVVQASARKQITSAKLDEAKADQIVVQNRKLQSETAKNLEEAKRTNLETHIATTTPVNQFNLSI